MKSIIDETNPLDAVKSRTGGRSAKVREAVLQAAHKILMDQGAEALTHRNVAQLADVNASTVYRRWPDRARLIADVFKSTADSLVKVPNTGNLHLDLLTFLKTIADMLATAEGKKLAQGGISAISSDDCVVQTAIRELWVFRFSQAEEMFHRAVERGEYVLSGSIKNLIEILIAPVWFRALVTSELTDDDYLKAHIDKVLSMSD